MSGRRSLLRSPKFGDGMTSETTEESGVNVFMLALPLGIGRARWRFESVPPDANEPECIETTKTGQENGNIASIRTETGGAIDALSEFRLFYQLCAPCISAPDGVLALPGGPGAG